jgi:hypothetical protein
VRITFLTGSLEPGADGVGDYARLLAGECSSRGVCCQVVAAADRHHDGALTDPGSGVEFVRISGRTSWSHRFPRVRETVQAFSPDWVSLQFVPYAFQRWGLPVGLIRQLPGAIATARLHLMLHEIWIHGEGSWRRRLVSAGQRRCVLALCRRPGTLVHTSNRTYQRVLERHHVQARLLPLFGNIPVSTRDAHAWLPAALPGIGADMLARRAGWWLCVMFGTIHPEWPPEPLMSRLLQAAAGQGKRVGILSVGRLGAGEAEWTTLQNRYRDRAAMVRLGEQPAGRISELLNTVDFGFATSPYALIHKSGTVAAMLDHGLPVIVNREDDSFVPGRTGEGSPDELVIRMDDRFAERLSGASRRPPRWRLHETAARFLADLNGSSLS